MTFKKNLKKVFSVFSLLLLFSIPANAELLNDLSVGDARSLSLAFAVTADSATIAAVHYNPAGLALLKNNHRQLSGGLKAFTLADRVGAQRVDQLNQALYDSLNPGETFPADPLADTGSSTSESVMILPKLGVTELGELSLPFVGFSYNSPGSKTTFATALFTPQSAGYRRDTNSPAAYQGETVAITRLTYLSPSLAIELTPQFMIGFGLHFSWQGLVIDTRLRTPQFLLAEILEAQIGSNLTGSVPLNAFNSFADVGHMRLDVSESASTQVNFGMLYKPSQWLTLGALYQAESRSQMKGTYQFEYTQEYLGGLIPAELAVNRIFNQSPREEGTVELDYVLPKRINLGVSVIVSDRLKVNVDLKQVFYSSLNSLDFQFSGRVDFLTIATLLDPTNANARSLRLPRDLSDEHSWSIGAEYRLTDSTILRSGYQHRSSVVPQDRVDFLLPIGTSELFSVGANYQWQQGNSLDFGYALVKTGIRADVGESVNANSSSPTNIIYNPYPFLPIESKKTTHLLQISWLKEL